MDNYSANPFTTGADPFTKFWTDCAARMVGTGFAPPSAQVSDEAMKQMRRAFFDAWAHHCEEFMSSPAFLEGMKRAMDGALAFREQLNEFMTRALHQVEAPARSDTDSIMLVLRSFEERVLDRLERLEHRVASLEDNAPAGRAENQPAGSVSDKPAARRREPKR